MKKLLKRCLSVFLFVGMVTGAGLLSSCGGSKTSTSGTSAAPSTGTSTHVSTSTGTSTEDTNQLEFVGAPESIYVEGTADLSVKCDGRNVSATITFTSSDEEVATVTATGRVRGVSVGEVTITAAADGYLDATLDLTVKSMTQDITVAITPAFTSGSLHQEVEDGYGIFFASALNWSTPIAATLNEDAGTWDVTLEDVEFNQNIAYNTYYGKVGGSGWDYINNEANGSSRSLAIVEGTLSYPITSTFEVPNQVASVEYIITLSIGDNEAINEGVYVYVSSDTNGWIKTAKATLNAADGTYRYTDYNVDIGFENYNICLGYEDELNWSYQYPAAGDTTNYFQVTADTTSFAVNAIFTSQPAPVNPDADEYSVTFGLLCNDSPNISNTQLVYDVLPNPNDKWVTMSPVATGEYTYTVTLTEGTYYFYFYAWDTSEHTIYAEAPSTAFSVVVDGGDVVIGVNGSFDTGIGTINDSYEPTVAYAVTFTLNCEDSPNPSGTQVVYDTVSPMSENKIWSGMTAGTSQYTYSVYLPVGTYYFAFYAWDSVVGDNWLYAGESSELFTVVVTDAAVSITVSGSFATGVGSVQA